MASQKTAKNNGFLKCIFKTISQLVKAKIYNMNEYIVAKSQQLSCKWTVNKFNNFSVFGVQLCRPVENNRSNHSFKGIDIPQCIFLSGEL